MFIMIWLVPTTINYWILFPECFQGMTDVAVEPKRPKTQWGEYRDRPQLKFSKLSSDAFTPTRGSALAAGYDLYAAHDTVLPPKGRGFVKTDLKVSFHCILNS